MLAAAGQVPDQPAIDRAKGQLAGLGLLARAGNVLQYPRNLGRRKIRVEQQPGLRADHPLCAIFHQLLTERRSPPVLPHDRVIDRLPRLAVPHNRRLALVGDADAGHIARPELQLAQRLNRRAQLRSENVERIVLDPSRLGKDLREFMLRLRRNVSLRIEENRPRTGGALV